MRGGRPFSLHSFNLIIPLNNSLKLLCTTRTLSEKLSNALWKVLNVNCVDRKITQTEDSRVSVATITFKKISFYTVYRKYSGFSDWSWWEFGRGANFGHAWSKPLILMKTQMTSHLKQNLQILSYNGFE